MKELVELFNHTFSEKWIDILELSPSGSNRKYYRLEAESGFTVIGTVNSDVEENRAFFAIAKAMSEQGIPVPRVYAVDLSERFYLQEDLGSESLFENLTNWELVQQSISKLPDIQCLTLNSLDVNQCYPQQEFNKRTIEFDLNYFKYSFLKHTNISFNEFQLAEDFEKIAKNLLASKPLGFHYRDFQSRNIMIKNNEPYFIDFQGARKGPVHYDLASFIYQAKANFTTEQREELITIYLSQLSKYIQVDTKKFNEELKVFALFRALQTLGAYGFRGLYEKKSHFIQSIPYGLKNVKDILDTLEDKYPTLSNIINLLVQKDSFAIPNNVEKKGLTIRISSFAYKNGIPFDPSGNGGGYAFDCRGLHNPGRYSEYKLLTGRDRSVIDFLEDQGEVQLYLDNIFSLADRHIESYLKRNFTDLMFNFGCTGGRHRSVYCADHLFEYLKNKYPKLRLELEHREQGIKDSYPGE